MKHKQRKQWAWSKTYAAHVSAHNRAMCHRKFNGWREEKKYFDDVAARYSDWLMVAQNLTVTEAQDRVDWQRERMAIPFTYERLPEEESTIEEEIQVDLGWRQAGYIEHRVLP